MTKYFVLYAYKPDPIYGSVLIMAGNTDHYDKKLVEFHWQYGSDRPDHLQEELYGFDYRLRGQNQDEFERQVKLVRYVLKKTNAGFDTQPGQVIEALARAGYRESAYDARYSEYLPLDVLQGPEYKLYIDDYNRLGNRQGCSYHAIETTMEAAQTSIMSQAIEHKKFDWLRKFIEADRPVFIPNHAEPPDMRTWVEKLADMGLGQIEKEPADAD